jgi:hypothetical protein
MHEPGYNLLELAHIARIFSSQEEFLYGTVELGRLTVGTSSAEEAFGERNNILEPFAKRRQLTEVTRDPVVKIGTKRAAIDHIQEVPGWSRKPAGTAFCTICCCPHVYRRVPGQAGAIALVEAAAIRRSRQETRSRRSPKQTLHGVPSMHP